jgi:hypothetical protein
MSSTASAPAPRASTICNGSIVKSLRSTGMDVAARAASRSASEPPKYVASVSTDIADAPPRS